LSDPVSGTIFPINNTNKESLDVVATATTKSPNTTNYDPMAKTRNNNDLSVPFDKSNNAIIEMSFESHS
jgi:hypothetical protein